MTPLNLLLCLLVYTGTWVALQRLRFDRLSRIIILAGLSFYYFHFFHSGVQQFSHDLNWHWSYLRDIARLNEIPPPDAGQAHGHPPGYYLLASFFYRLASGGADAIPAVRQLSVMLYTGFILFAARLLRANLPKDSGAYYAGLALAVFWPIGIAIASRVNSDLLLYLGSIGTLYHVIEYRKRQEITSLVSAFIWAGVGMLAKASGILYLILPFLCLAWPLRRRAWNIKLLAAIAFALAATAYTYHRALPFEYIVPHHDPALHSLRANTVFDLPLFLSHTVYDTFHGESRTLFWNRFLRTAILGEFYWHAPRLLLGVGTLWIAMLCYLTAGTAQVYRRDAAQRPLFNLLFFSLFISIASLMAARLRISHFACAEARCIYPFIVIVIYLFACSVEEYRQQGKKRLWLVGHALAAMMVLASIFLYLVEHRFL